MSDRFGNICAFSAWLHKCGLQGESQTFCPDFHNGLVSEVWDLGLPVKLLLRFKARGFYAVVVLWLSEKTV